MWIASRGAVQRIERRDSVRPQAAKMTREGCANEVSRLLAGAMHPISMCPREPVSAPPAERQGSTGADEEAVSADNTRVMLVPIPLSRTERWSMAAKNPTFCSLSRPVYHRECLVSSVMSTRMASIGLPAMIPVCTAAPSATTPSGLIDI